MLYLIGLGLNEKGYSREAYEAISGADRVYIDSYTVQYPYDINKLREQFEKKEFIPADRNFVENLGLVDMAKNNNIVLLVYGSPLTATTHITLIQEAKKKGIKVKIIHSASVIDAVSETGLQLYKFGKITSMPIWDKSKNYTPDSFLDTVKDNKKMEAHSLILIDIGMEFSEALEQLEKASEKKELVLGKVIACSRLGTQSQRIYYASIGDLKKKSDIIKASFSIIIPGKQHFVEEEVLKGFEIKDKMNSKPNLPNSEN